MRPQPYIGITGFTHRDQVNAVVNALPLNTDRLVMAGLLVSNRTLRGETNKRPNRYPRPELLSGIFLGYTCLLNLIHFNTKEPEHLLEDMTKAQNLAGPDCHGFQLNMAWPDPRVLEQYKKTAFRNKIVVLQCGGGAIRQAVSPFDLSLRLKDYAGLAEYVLVDPSGGLGKEFDLEFARSYLYYIRENAPDTMSMGIAGGLHAANLDRLEPLLAEFNFSIDAEGRLRDKDDNLDLAAAVAYVRMADRLFRTYRRAA